MNDVSREPVGETDVPKATVRPSTWLMSVMWIVPVVAIAVAAYLVMDRYREYGPEITIRFSDGGGVRVGQTPIKYRGVTIGEVTAVELTEDRQRVGVKARLQRSAAPIATKGSVFWIVRPELGVANVTGLSTVITGPEIQVVPGRGEEKATEFDGMDSAPAGLELQGLRIVLRTSRVGSLGRSSPVYYRGVEVGVIQSVDLSSNAAMVDVTVLIRQRYVGLVRSGSTFWNVSGVSMSGGLFKGMEFKLESIRSLAAGGIAFATPDDKYATPVKQGAIFALYDEPRKEWLAWTPRINVPREK